MRSQFLQSPQLGGYGRRSTPSGGPFAAYAAGGHEPPLVLDYIDGVYGTGGETSDFAATANFARTSAATYFDATGTVQTAASGEARTAHHVYKDGWTVGGLLLEPAATNVLAFSEDFTQSAWLKNSSTVSQTVAGPDGAANSATIVSDNNSGGTGSFNVAENVVSVSPSSKWSWSTFARPGTLGGLLMYELAYTSPPTNGFYFDLANGEVAGSYFVSQVGLAARIDSAGDGWYRTALLMKTEANTATYGHLQAYGADVSGSPTNVVAMDGSSNFHLFGAQLEESPLPTSYIATDGGSATRAADSLTVPAGNVAGDFFAMSGFLNYADGDQAEQQVLLKREVDASNLMKVTLDTSGANTGTITLTVITAGVPATVSTAADLTPGLDVPFYIAFGATGTEIALAMGGVVETRMSSGLPDLSAADVEINMHGTLSRLINYENDIGDTGLGEVSSAGFFSQLTGRYDAQVNHFLVYGQSLSMGISPALSTSEDYDHLMFYRGLRAHLDYPEETPAEWYASLVHCVEASVETPTRGAFDMVKELIDAEEGLLFTDHRYQLLGGNPGMGGTSIAQLSYGTDGFSRLIDQITRGRSLATAEGDTYAVQAVSWTQGTTDYLVGTDFATYLTRLNTLVSDIQTHGTAASGQSKPIAVIGTQVAAHKAAASDDAPDVALAQLYCSEHNPDFYLAAPLYFLPYKDQFHPTAEGERWLGAYLGLAYKRIVIDGENWSPLRPVSWTQDGANLDVTFHVRAAGSLQWDTATVPAQPDFGFELVDNAGSPLAIAAVNITGADTVRIVASAPIPAGARLRYAWQGDTDKGLGNLRDDQGDTVVFDPDGDNRPMHNWCAIFEVDA